MFPIAFITDEATQSLDEAIQLAQSMGIQGLELRSVNDQPIDQIPEDELKQMAKQIEAAGLKVPCLAGSYLKVDLNTPGITDVEDAKLDRLIAATKILKAPAIRGFAGLKSGDEPAPIEALVPLFKRIEQKLKDHGLKLYLEADPHVNTSNHKAIAELLEAVGSDTFGAIFDPGNCLYDPLGEIPFPNGYTAVQSHIGHVHIKDVTYDEKGEPYCLKIGDGDVPFLAILTQLKKDGYTGWVSLETHYRKASKLTDEQMLHPQGADFSSGGMEAMEESIEVVQSMIQEVFSV